MTTRPGPSVRRADSYARGLELHRAGRLDESEPIFRAIVEADPADAASLHLLAMIAAQRGRLEEAAGLFRRSLAVEPANGPAYFNLGVVLRELGKPEEALAALRSAAELKPSDPEPSFAMSMVLQEVGRADEALEAADRVLTIHPTHARAWRVRSDLKTFARDDGDIARLVDLVDGEASRRMDSDDRADLLFALGKALIDLGDIDGAFARLAAANQLKRAGSDYDVEADTNWFVAAASMASDELIASLAFGGEASDRPVFVLGMPRSGTTLIEQVLAAHPHVHGAGELRALQDAILEASGRNDVGEGTLALLAAPAEQRIAVLGRSYLERTGGIGPKKRRLVDKAPGNFRFVPLIRMALPNARIIHCRRDPLDTCLSCYARKLEGLKYAFDLRELGRYYRAYEAAVSRWRGRLPPDRYLEVSYEDVVADPEGQSRRLVAFLGLDWDPACLDFHRSGRIVRTASVNQVRRPIYDSSIGRWRLFEQQLGPLIEALGDGHGR